MVLGLLLSTYYQPSAILHFRQRHLDRPFTIFGRTNNLMQLLTETCMSRATLSVLSYSYYFLSPLIINFRRDPLYKPL